MIKENLHNFMSAVKMRADEWKEKSFEECMSGFLKKTIKESTTLNIPENTPLDTKKNVINESTATINDAAKKIVNNAFVDDHSSMHNIDFAKEIINPKDLNESVQQLLAEHITNEANDKMSVLQAEFEAGKFNNLSSTETLEYIENSFGKAGSFESKFANGENLKAQMNVLLSTEGESLVDSIKKDVSTLVSETEAKNSVIREAVSEINDKKAKIEEQINGESDPDAGSDEEKKVGKDGDIAEQEKDLEKNPDSVQSLGGNVAKGTEGWYNIATKKVGKTLSKESLYEIIDLDSSVFSNENLATTYDETSFSREAAEEILGQFRELDDGINSEEVPENENTLSVSDGDEDVPTEGGSEAESAEMTYTDDNDEPIEINNDAFNYDTEHEIKPDVLSEESMAKDFMPLSFKKFCGRSIKPNNKLIAFLAVTPDGGKQFFNSVRSRSIEMVNMLSEEDAVSDTISNDKINEQIETRLNETNKLEETTNKVIDSLGILGILSGDYQRTGDPAQNAVNSLIKPEIIKPKDTPDISTEELHEHELAEIFKLAIKVSDIKNDIIKGIDVMGNKQQLGYLEELLNEKIFALDDIEKGDVENKVKALQSIESIIPVQEIINMKVFASKSAGTDTKERITLDSLKDIDAYGFCYADEIEKIKKNVEKKYNEQFGSKYKSINFNIYDLVEFVVDEKDTTKMNSNLFEKVLAKCTGNIDISNSSEALIVLNKARALTTAFVTADKIGMLSKEELNNIKNMLMY
jgi:hypothetical protein